MGWRIVEIQTDEHLSLYLNNIQIVRQNEKILINILDIDLLIINNDRTSMSLKLLNSLSKANVSCIVFDQNHEPCTQIVPVEGNHMSLKVLESQINWNSKYKGGLWQMIIKNKIFNQLRTLEELKIKNDSMWWKEMINDVKHFDITNREGHAAKVYWNTLFGVKFIRSQKCIEYPIINGMLNYGYAILRTLVIRAIYKKGLDPRIALFHKSFTNFFALASDLMEVFRPLVDMIIYKNRDSLSFTINIRDQLINIYEVKVRICDKKQTLSNAIDIYLDHIAKGNMLPWVDLWD